MLFRAVFFIGVPEEPTGETDGDRLIAVIVASGGGSEEATGAEVVGISVLTASD